MPHTDRDANADEIATIVAQLIKDQQHDERRRQEVTVAGRVLGSPNARFRLEAAHGVLVLEIGEYPTRRTRRD